MKGTLIYQAPELSRGERYGFAADVFSFALTMYEVCDRVSVGGVSLKLNVILVALAMASHPTLSLHRIFHILDQREITGSSLRLI